MHRYSCLKCIEHCQEIIENLRITRQMQSKDEYCHDFKGHKVRRQQDHQILKKHGGHI